MNGLTWAVLHPYRYRMSDDDEIKGRKSCDKPIAAREQWARDGRLLTRTAPACRRVSAW
jgi:hypothetical protein